MSIKDIEAAGACPGEGCVYREWVANRAVVIRVDRRPAAGVAFQVKNGEKVTAVTGVVVTLKAGRVQFGQPQDITSMDGQIHIVPGQTLSADIRRRGLHKGMVQRPPVSIRRHGQLL
jgi:hypothetical protein